MTEQLVLFLVDGMRADGLQQAATPTIDALAAAGARTFKARTVMPCCTLPCHISLFYSVTPERHGVTTNRWSPPDEPVPSISECLKAAGKTCASFYNWEKLRDTSRAGTQSADFFLRNCNVPEGDCEIAELAAGYLRRQQPNFTFVYFGYTDTAGETEGFMSPTYMDAIANADECVGKVLAALSPDATVLVTSDHGGHDKTHGIDCAEDMTIPLVIKGAGIPADTVIGQPVAITDIAPTILDRLGVDTPPQWVGKAIDFS